MRAVHVAEAVRAVHVADAGRAGDGARSRGPARVMAGPSRRFAIRRAGAAYYERYGRGRP